MTYFFRCIVTFLCYDYVINYLYTVILFVMNYVSYFLYEVIVFYIDDINLTYIKYLTLQLSKILKQ